MKPTDISSQLSLLQEMRLPRANLSQEAFAAPLLSWYDEQGRHLPWRQRWPVLSPAYDVFLSELMLQQTVVATVIPYFERFKTLWPTIADLAACDEADLLREWAGLGYYARARNMKKAAICVMRDHGGVFPQDEASLLALPGIGPYTAAAIQSFAFDKPAIVIDGNIERVMSRFAGLTTPLPELKSDLRVVFPKLAGKERHSDFPQAIMDLGARICISAKPRCALCPLSADCVMAGLPEANLLPVKAKKKPKPKRTGVVFLATMDGKAMMVRRPDKGLLGGMMGFPTFGWDNAKAQGASLADAPFAADWKMLSAKVRHIFTHFELELQIVHVALDKALLTKAHNLSYELVTPEEVGLASVFAKVWQSYQKQAH